MTKTARPKFSHNFSECGQPLSLGCALGCDDFWSFIGRPCGKAAAAWDHGDNELVVSGYAYHLRSTYTEDKLRELNEKAWGAGWARSVNDADGDNHMLFLFGFHESHNKVQWNGGYAYTTYWGRQDGVRAGPYRAHFLRVDPRERHHLSRVTVWVG